MSRLRIASTGIRPTPGHWNTISIWIAPDSTKPAWRPGTGMIDTIAAFSAWRQITPRSGTPFGARGADEVLTQHLQHREAGELGDDAGRDDGQRQRRQRQVADQRAQVARTVDRPHARDR